MKLLTKIAQAGTGLVLLSTVAMNTGSAVAGVPGQIAGGNQNYTIANVTKGTGFANPQTADACDVLQYRLRLYNPGPSPLGDVKMEASINTMTPYTSANSTATVYTPDGQTKEVAFQAVVNISTAQTQAYQKGSTKLLDSAGNVIKSSANGTLADTITMGGGGIDLGSLTDSTTEYVEFNTVLGCPTPPPAPVYSCDAFNIVADVNRTVKISAFSTTAKNGASFTNAVVTWGDTSSPLSSANIVGQTHQYAKDDTYTVTATAHFSVNGKDVTAGGPQCVKQVTFSSTKPPTVTPPTTPPATPATPAAPTALVNTGPGSVMGLFAATTAIGAVAHRWMLGRRLSRQ
jgi:hypothetical protein